MANRASSFSTSRKQTPRWLIAVFTLTALTFAGVWELFRGGAHRPHLLLVFLGFFLSGIAVLAAELLRNRSTLAETRLAHDRMRNALLAGNSFAWDHDVQTGEDQWFGDLKTIFGIASDRFTIQQSEFYRRVHPDDRRRVAEAVAHAQANRSQYESEFRVVREDGSLRWVSATGEFQYSRKGDPVRMFGIATDITERRMAEEERDKSEEKFSKAFHQSPIAMTLTSTRDHRYLDVNHAFERDSGWRRDEAVGRTPFDLKIWPDPKVREGLVKKTLAEKQLRDVEIPFRRKDGRPGVGLISAELVQIGDEPCILGAIVDISDRKQAEQELRKKEHDLAEAQRLAHVGSWEWDIEAGVIRWSEELYRIYGLDPTHPAPTVEELPRLHTPETWSRLQRAMEARSFPDMELELVRPDGSKRWVHTRFEHTKKSEGTVTKLRGVCQDITQEKQVRDQLQESEARMQAVVSSAMDAIITVDDDQMIVVFNRAAEKMFQCPTSEAIGTHLSRFIPPPFRAGHEMLVAEYGKTSITSREHGKLGELYALRSNGEAFPMEASISSAESGGRKFFTVIIRDVTERLRAEHELQDSEEKFRRVVEHIGDAVIADDLDGHVTFANDRFLELFGFCREQLTNLGFENYIAPEYRDQLVDRHRRRMRGEDVPTHFEYEGLRADGSRMWLEVDVVPVTDREGRIVGTQSAIQDITQRKHAQQVIRESEERLRRVVEHIADALVVDDVAGRITFANDQFLKLFGLRREELEGVMLESYVAPEDQATLRDRHDRQMRGEELDSRYEFQGMRRNGTRLWIEAEIVAIKDPAGKVIGSQRLLRDRTHQKRAEQVLRESEERLRHLIGSSHDWVWEVDANARYTYAGPQCRSILGYEPDEIVGKTPFDLMPADEAARIASEFSSIAAERKVFRSLRNINRHKDGHLVVLETNGVPILDADGNFRGYRGLDRDITERDRAEQALRESEERFRLVANTAPVMIWMCDSDDQCTYFNKPWLDFTGRTIDQELGEGWLESVHPEDLQSCVETSKEGFRKRVTVEVQYRLRRHDGQYRWILDFGVPRFNEDGSFAGYIGSCIDITERKQAEEAMATMGRRLIEAHEEERTWIGRELHDDVNQRLAFLSVELDRGLKNHRPGPHIREVILHAQERITELSKDVQSLSHRLHSSKLEYLGLARAADSFCRELSEQSKIEVAFTQEGIPRTLPKEISLCVFRVLQEALQNAVKYSGVRHFTVDLRGSSSSIELSVTDTGCGFDPEEAFNRKGLGLISMRERLQMVRGELSVRSTPGTGTTVYARIPLENIEPQAMAG